MLVDSVNFNGNPFTNNEIWEILCNGLPNKLCIDSLKSKIWQSIGYEQIDALTNKILEKSFSLLGKKFRALCIKNTDKANLQETKGLMSLLKRMLWVKEEYNEIVEELFQKSLIKPLPIGLDKSTLKSQCILKCVTSNVNVTNLPEDLQVQHLLPVLISARHYWFSRN
jgi:hypothetical protein